MAKVKNPNRCVHCDSDNLTAEHFEDGGYDASRKVVCEDCGKTQTEIWKLVSVEGDSKDEKEPR